MSREDMEAAMCMVLPLNPKLPIKNLNKDNQMNPNDTHNLPTNPYARVSLNDKELSHWVYHGTIDADNITQAQLNQLAGASQEAVDEVQGELDFANDQLDDAVKYITEINAVANKMFKGGEDAMDDEENLKPLIDALMEYENLEKLTADDFE